MVVSAVLIFGAATGRGFTRENIVDCAVIGGGPAGLTAGTYLARFCRNVRIVDAGEARASLIPLSRNVPGFPQGIAGPDLLKRMRLQARRNGVILSAGPVEGLSSSKDGFRVEMANGALLARTVLIATGVINHRPEMAPGDHDRALQQGLLRYCPVCDGFEAKGVRIAVLGGGEHGATEAEFVRTFSPNVTLLAQQTQAMDMATRHALAKRDIRVVEIPVAKIEVGDHNIAACFSNNVEMAFDTLYVALGSTPRADFALDIGASLDTSGTIKVDAHQETDVRGVFAAGDVVAGLDQISVAVGQAAIAATAIHNRLCALDSEREIAGLQ